MTFSYSLSYVKQNGKIYKQNFSYYSMKKSGVFLCDVVTIGDENWIKDLKSIQRGVF